MKMLRTAMMFIVPVVLLAGVIALFAFTRGAGLNVAPAAPLESLAFEQTVLKPGVIELHVRNTGPEADHPVGGQHPRQYRAVHGVAQRHHPPLGARRRDYPLSLAAGQSVRCHHLLIELHSPGNDDRRSSRQRVAPTPRRC